MPQAGDRYRLKNDIGLAPDVIEAGTEGTVREVVPASEPGAHDNSEDAIVVEFPIAATGALRAVSFGLSQIDTYLEVV